MRERGRRPTAIKLGAGIVVLAVLVGFAVPTVVNLDDQARREVAQAMADAVEAGLAKMHKAYAEGDTAGLPPDTDGDGYPDHLGDVAFGEPTLLDAILDPPHRPGEGDLRQYPTFPWMDCFYGYFFDTDQDGVLDVTESYILYDSSTGTLQTHIPR